MKKQITQLVDDLDGTVLEHGGTTIRFSLEGRSYEIDLSSDNADKFRRAMAPFIAAGRATAGRTTSGVRRPSRNASGELAAIRSWAQSHGFTVGDRGRISAEVRDAYERAH
ncbi:MAG: Lsr2 family protein [Pseudolysinimonas sp.]|uniref:histone-like nucleoid-structuring protein Lsr2 n=1 Tax=Pseudolysinimonas sp. TaxID=2680009 RepID=UPI00326328EB